MSPGHIGVIANPYTLQRHCLPTVDHMLDRDQ